MFSWRISCYNTFCFRNKFGVSILVKRSFRILGLEIRKNYVLCSIKLPLHSFKIKTQIYSLIY